MSQNGLIKRSNYWQEQSNKAWDIPLPTDVITATEFSATATPTERSLDNIRSEEMILDVGSQTASTYHAIMQAAGTIVWNGPVGVFEFEAFSQGTHALADAVAASHAFSIAGGGDTLAALEKFNIMKKISYICTGGGAFLEFLAGNELPAVAILRGKYVR